MNIQLQRRQLLFALPFVPIVPLIACGSVPPPVQACMPGERKQQIIDEAEQALRQSIVVPASARIELAFIGQPCDLDRIPPNAVLKMHAERLHAPTPVMKVLVDAHEGTRKEQVFLAFRVRAWVRTVVVARRVQDGEVFGMQDCAEQDVDMASSGPTLTRIPAPGSRWISLRPLSPGTPLSPSTIASAI